jgi:hypothetical protein
MHNFVNFLQILSRSCGMYGQKKNAYGCLRGNLKERNDFEDLSVNGRISNWNL